MRAFTELYTALDRTTGTNDKVAALVAYFAAVPDADAAWALHFLVGGRLKRAVTSRVLRDAAAAAAELPAWMVDECYGVVGDLGEALALLVPGAERVPPCAAAPAGGGRAAAAGHAPPDERAAQRLMGQWARMEPGRSGSCGTSSSPGRFRVGVWRKLVVRALARVAGAGRGGARAPADGHLGTDARSVIAALLEEDAATADIARPYPFFLAHPLEEGAGLPGRRRRTGRRSGSGTASAPSSSAAAGQTFLWSRGEELVTERFPEIAAAAACACRTARCWTARSWRGGRTAAALRRAPAAHRPEERSAQACWREVPVVFLAYDLLESEGRTSARCRCGSVAVRLDALLGPHAESAHPLSPVVPMPALGGAGRGCAERAGERARRG